MPPPSLHAGLIERTPPRPTAQWALSPRSASAHPMDLASLPELQPVKPPRSTVTLVPPPKALKRRRFGLTVRVAPETREVLEELRARTGQTFQQILHRAVTEHLNST